MRKRTAGSPSVGAMPLPPKEFVTRVKETLGVESPTEFAKAIRLGGYNAPQRARRWLEGDHAPDYEATMLMLEAVGWIAIPTTNGAGSATPERVLDEAAVAAAIHEIADVLDRLTLLVAAQEQPPPRKRRRSA